ncbi:MAG: hypothetical protein ABEJ62_02790 [Candidatus Nanohaloarchaea archaeon]
MGLEDIFRAYDVRSDTETLTPEVMERTGKAFGSKVREEGVEEVLVGRDVRESSPALLESLIDGVTSTGVNVLNAGMVPAGVVLYGSWERDVPSAYVTASHLPRGNNGVKFTRAGGTGYVEEENMDVRDRFLDEDFLHGEGGREEVDILGGYREHLLESVNLGEVKVLMDPGNGAASAAAPDLFWQAGAELEVVNGDPDGTFPHRESDVDDESLAETITRVREGDYDLGVAYDGDADRVAVMDDEGRLLSAEETAAVLLDEIHGDGPVVANVECSRLVEEAAGEHGAEVVRSRVGHSYMVQAVKENDARLGVEASRHIAVPGLFPADDGVAVSLLVAAAVSHMGGGLSDRVEDMPEYPGERVSFDADPGIKFQVVEELEEELSEEYGDTDALDGIRVNLEEGWALVRASNTSPLVRLTVEAEDRESFEEMKEEFSRRIERKIDELS